MKWSMRTDTASVVAAQAVAVGTALVTVAFGAPVAAAIGAAALLAVAMMLVSVQGIPVWRWAVLAAGLLRSRDRDLPAAEPSDIDSDGDTLGVLIEGHTVVTMVELRGKAYTPTLLRPDGAETPNTVPVSVIAAQMRRVGLGVEVDIISQGRRATSDQYGGLYSSLLGDRPAAGQRTNVLVVRLDTRAPDTARGLMWRRTTADAAAAATRRIVRALRQSGCRAEPMTAAQMREAVHDMLGGAEHVEPGYRQNWSDVTPRGRHGRHTTSYYFDGADLRPDRLSDVWSINAEHTVLALHLRRRDERIMVSASARFTTAQPLVAAPLRTLNRFSGRQWWALTATLPGAKRITDIPAVELSHDIDRAVHIGPSGVLLGQVGDGLLLLMPITDPARQTRITVESDDVMSIRRIIRRSAAAGERVAVYDPPRHWTMTSGSSRIWFSHDLSASPPAAPTMVVHNGIARPFPMAASTVAVGGRDPDADIRITERRGRITVATRRFTAHIDAVGFRNEEMFLT